MGNACVNHSNTLSPTEQDYIGFDAVLLSIIVVQDNGWFDGLATTAHEIGHSLGALHDEIYNKCCFCDGYIMSYPDLKMLRQGNLLTFSPCNVEEIDNYLKSGWGNCLFDKPSKELVNTIFDTHERHYSTGTNDHPLIDPKKLKGANLPSLEEQCTGVGKLPFNC